MNDLERRLKLMETASAKGQSQEEDNTKDNIVNDDLKF